MNTPEGAGTGGGADPVALNRLDRAECLRLIAPGGVGRVAFDDGEGPTVIPVNYVMDGESVVFRTSLGGRLHWSLTTAMAGAEVRIAFEVDRIDADEREGWSVLLRGGAHQLADEEAAAEVEPWPEGEREARVRLSPRKITGRRLRRC